MCGLSGFLLRGAARPEAELTEHLWAMNRTMRHRGPDDQGVWTDGRVGLSHNRLSIIDLSPAGHQPMIAEDGTRIVFNGEVYNFPVLREELETAGYRFQSRTDTEVILHGYRAWGEGVFARLRGMFAVAIWDPNGGRLVLGRDRLGKKPLYYAWLGDAFVFGSEIKSILAWPSLTPQPDLEAIDLYLTYQYIPAPFTAFIGVRKLLPAHLMVLDVNAGGQVAEPRIDCYWRLPPPVEGRGTARPGDLEAELIERLQEAVRLRLISDVPLGAFLSGGVDSSAIIAMMARLGVADIKTFSIGFAHDDYDETQYARMVAKQYGTDHEELIVEADAIELLPKLVWHYGEPFADPSAIPTYYVSELARKHVTVALNGDGGDENFIGYHRYAAMRSVARASRLPGGLLNAAASVLSAVPRQIDRKARGPRIGSALRQMSEKASRRYAFTIVFFSDADKELAYAEPMRGHLASSALDRLDPLFAEAPSLVSGAVYADIHTYLPDDLLVKVDVASMAHSLEARSPFLDHEFMEWAAVIPEEARMAGGETKALLKRALEPMLPKEILYRRKMGFGCPIDHWLRGDIRDYAYDVLLSGRFRDRGILRQDYVRDLLDEHCAGERDHHYRLWSLLFLEQWYRTWIDAAESEPPVAMAAAL